MNILMISDTFPPHVNGAALATDRLAKELVKRNHHVAVVAPSTSFMVSKEHDGKIIIYRLKSIPILFDRVQDFRFSPKPFHEKELRKIIEKFKPDIIHINEPWFMGLSAIEIAREKQIPIISTHHFMPENLVHYLHLPERIEKMINRKTWKWYAKICNKLNLVICPTQAAKNILTKYNQGIDIKVISNGIDLKIFTPKNNGDYLKQKFGLRNIPTLLFVGRLDKEKNIDVLIHASALLKNRTDFQLLIAGQGKEKDELIKLASDLGVLEKIIFTDYLPDKDLPNIYKIADIFVMPSIAELQSLVTMEAMATGLPVVGADAVALPHLVINGKNGYLFKPGDATDLAKKLLPLLSDADLRQKMGKASLDIIQEHDVDKVITEFENTYKDVISHYEMPVAEEEKLSKNVIKNLKKINLKKNSFPGII